MSEPRPGAPAGNPSIFFTAPDRIEILDRPVPIPGPGEVLIRTRRTLISTGTELTLLRGAAPEGSVWADLARYPLAVGYSNAGEVTALGVGVEPRWLGRRVETHGRHAAFVTATVDRLRGVPEGVSDEEATFSSLAEVAMNGLRRIGLTWGESIAVFGLGILGQLAVRLAGLAGAGPVLGVEPSELRRRLLPTGPFFRALAGGDEVREEVRVATAGRGLDVVVELTGDPEVIPTQPVLLRDQGRLLILSSPRGPSRFDFHDLCNRRSLSIVGAHGFSHPPMETPNTPWTGRRHGELFLERVAAGALTVRELITHRFAAEAALDAYRLLAERRSEALGVVLEW